MNCYSGLLPVPRTASGCCGYNVKIPKRATIRYDAITGPVRSAVRKTIHVCKTAITGKSKSSQARRSLSRFVGPLLRRKTLSVLVPLCRFVPAKPLLVLRCHTRH